MDNDEDDLYSGYGEEGIPDSPYGFGPRTYSSERLGTSSSRTTMFAKNPRIGTSVSRISSAKYIPSSPWHDKRPPTPTFVPGTGTATRPATSRLGAMASRPGTNLTTDTAPGFNRPRTGTTSAGYRPSSSGQSTMFRPGTSTSRFSLIENIRLDPEETPIMKLKKFKREINQIVDDSQDLLSNGEKTKALEMGKHASEKEKELVKLETEAETYHDWDITFVVLYNLAQIYENMELYEDALATYSTLLIEKFSLQEGQVRFCIGNIYMNQAKYPAAIKAFRTTLDKIGVTNNRLRAKLLLQCGIAFVKINKPEEAVVCFESIMVIRPSVKAGFLLCMANCIEKEYQAARTSFLLLLDVPVPMKPENQTDDPTIDELKDLLSSDPLARYEKQLLAYAEKCVLTAGRCIAPFIDITACDGYDWVLKTLRRSNYGYLAPALEISKSLELLKLHKHDEVIELLKRVADQPTRFQTLAATNLCHLYLLKGDVKKALKYGKISVFGNHGDSYNSSGFINLGNCYVAEGNMEEAGNMYKQGLSMDPTNINGLYNMGLLSQKTGNFKEALNWFYKVLKQVPTFADVTFQIASTLEMRRDTGRAYDWYNKALSRSPNDPEILFRLGLNCDAEGDKIQAYQYFYDSFRVNPMDLDVIKWLLNYVTSYRIRPEEAEKYFSQGTRLQPNNPYWSKSLSICYKRVGEVDKAIDILRKAHSEFPDDQDVLEQLIKLTSGIDEYEAGYYENQLERLKSEMAAHSTPPNTSTHETEQSGQLVTYCSKSQMKLKSKSKYESESKFITPRIPQSYIGSESEGDGEVDELEQFFENVDVTPLLNVDQSQESN